MTSINDAFPSKYLKAADLKGRNRVVTIDHAEFEIINNDQKLILYFDGQEKGMVLNKTNAGNIANAYGDDTDDWKGQSIVLFEAMVDYQGKTVPAIRVRMPQAKDRPRQPVRQSSADMGRDEPPPHTSIPQNDADDEIPWK